MQQIPEDVAMMVARAVTDAAVSCEDPSHKRHMREVAIASNARRIEFGRRVLARYCKRSGDAPLHPRWDAMIAWCKKHWRLLVAIKIAVFIAIAF